MRVLVVAQRPIARAGLRSLLRESPIEIAGEVSGMEQASLTPSDVIFAELPDELTEEWLQSIETLATSETYAVVLGEPTQKQIKQMIEVGVRGMVSSELEIEATLRAVSKGLFVIEPRLLQTMLAPQEIHSEESDGFTEREREVLELLARGWPNRMIANKLQISEHTAKFHVASLLQKLGASSRTEAVTRAVRKGFVAL